MKTAMQELKEMLDEQVKSMDKQTEHKLGALWGLYMAMLYLGSLIDKERKQIEDAFVAGSERGNGDIPFNCEQYYSQTYKQQP